MKRIALYLFLASPLVSFAHDVPDEVRIRAFLKPEADHMTILVRIPANALIDILFPMQPGRSWLDLKRAIGAAREGARIWVADQITLYEDGNRLPEPQVLAVCLTQMPDGDFSTYERAARHIAEGGAVGDDLFTQDEAAVDVSLQTPIHSRFANFSIETGWARVGVRVTTSLAFLPANGGVRQFEFEGDPGKIHLDPNLSDALLRSFRDGYRHLFSASDYLLFLLSVALLFPTMGRLTRFAVPMILSASVAFFWAAFGLWISSPLAEVWWGVFVGAVVVYMGFEAIVRQAGLRTQMVISILCGFVFGTGYWFAFRPQMQFGGIHKFASVLAFDCGIQLIQIAILAAAAAATNVLLRVSANPLVMATICGAFLLRISWHRLLDRARAVAESPVPRPAITPVVAITIAAIVSIELIVAYVMAPKKFESARGRSAAEESEECLSN